MHNHALYVNFQLVFLAKKNVKRKLKEYTKGFKENMDDLKSLMGCTKESDMLLLMES